MAFRIFAMCCIAVLLLRSIWSLILAVRNGLVWFGLVGFRLGIFCMVFTGRVCVINMFAVAAHCTFLLPKINVVGKCVLLTWPLAMIKLEEQRTGLCISHISYSYNTMGRRVSVLLRLHFPTASVLNYVPIKHLEKRQLLCSIRRRMSV